KKEQSNNLVTYSEGEYESVGSSEGEYESNYKEQYESTYPAAAALPPSTIEAGTFGHINEAILNWEDEHSILYSRKRFVSWDAYENFIIDWAKKQSFRIVKDRVCREEGFIHRRTFYVIITNNPETAIIVNKVKDEHNHMLSQDIIEFEDGKKFTDQMIEDVRFMTIFADKFMQEIEPIVPNYNGCVPYLSVFDQTETDFYEENLTVLEQKIVYGRLHRIYKKALHKALQDNKSQQLINLLEEFVEIESDKSSDSEESLHDNTSDKKNHDSVTTVQIQNPKKRRGKGQLLGTKRFKSSYESSKSTKNQRRCKKCENVGHYQKNYK
ncbi:4530_t:CDS:2, partial [Racocetra fulgida]